jgi:hypothetical protein
MMHWNPESAQNDSAAAKDCVNAAALADQLHLSSYKKLSNDGGTHVSQTNAAEFASALQQQLKPENFQAWQQHAYRFCTRQMAQTDLATALTTFCLSKLSEQSKLTSERLK